VALPRTVGYVITESYLTYVKPAACITSTQFAQLKSQGSWQWRLYIMICVRFCGAAVWSAFTGRTGGLISDGRRPGITFTRCTVGPHWLLQPFLVWSDHQRQIRLRPRPAAAPQNQQ